MISKSLLVPEIGTITIEKKKRQKSLRIRLHPDKGIFVSIPSYLSDAAAKEFVYRNLDWIKKKKELLAKKKQTELFDLNSVFETNWHKLSVWQNGKDKSRISINNGVISVSLERDIEIFDIKAQDLIKKAIFKALYIEAEIYLPSRCEAIASEKGFVYSKLRIGKAKRRWGSCRSDNSITLSCVLMLLPKHLIDYVILHELCHTIHKNHSGDFHTLLNEKTEFKSKELNRQLKEFSANISPGNFKYNE